MKGVVLAAGDGGRLRPLTLHTPKVLLDLGGRPLIHYSLEALDAAGITEIVVIVGYEAQQIVDALKGTHPNIDFVFNEHYDGDNAISVNAARSFVKDEPFVLCMGDHPISPEIVKCLLENHDERCVLCVDSTACLSSQVDDGTRVLINSDGFIEDIGKTIDEWSAIDTGVFMMTDAVFPVIDHLMKQQGVDVGITDMVRFLGASGYPFATCDVSGMFWADVDTPEDYKSTEMLMRQRNGKRV